MRYSMWSKKKVRTILIAKIQNFERTTKYIYLQEAKRKYKNLWYDKIHFSTKKIDLISINLGRNIRWIGNMWWKWNVYEYQIRLSTKIDQHFIQCDCECPKCDSRNEYDMSGICIKIEFVFRQDWLDFHTMRLWMSKMWL